VAVVAVRWGGVAWKAGQMFAAELVVEGRVQIAAELCSVREGKLGRVLRLRRRGLEVLGAAVEVERLVGRRQPALAAERPG
jgi:hypothetical protein